jgi:FKBP-type peptidyl-prolyl cis-trans isomerase
MRFILAVLLVFLVIRLPAVAQQSPFSPPPDAGSPPADAVKSDSGLISKVQMPGTGSEKPQATDIVTVHYTGWVASDGRMFDSSVARGTPSSFPLDRVMAGWRECVQLMAVGERRRCWIPEKLAYRGQAGRPTGTVVFDIELIDVRRNPRIAPPDVKAPPDDAKRTATGLAYKVLRPGTGTRNPAAWSRVTVHYTGWTVDGKDVRQLGGAGHADNVRPDGRDPGLDRRRGADGGRRAHALLDSGEPGLQRTDGPAARHAGLRYRIDQDRMTAG